MVSFVDKFMIVEYVFLEMLEFKFFVSFKMYFKYFLFWFRKCFLLLELESFKI